MPQQAGAQPLAPTHPGSRALLDPRLQALEAAIDKARKSNRPIILCTLPTIAWEQTSGLDPNVLNLLQGCTLRHDIHIGPPRPSDIQVQIQTVLPEPAPAAAVATAGLGMGATDTGGTAVQATAAAVGVGALGADVIALNGANGLGAASAGAGEAAGSGEGGAAGAEKSASAPRVRNKTEFPAALLPSLLAHLATSPVGAIDKVRPTRFATAHVHTPGSQVNNAIPDSRWPQDLASVTVLSSACVCYG